MKHKLAEGDTVQVYDDMRSEWYEGVVQSLLSTQFTYKTKTTPLGEPQQRYAAYGDEWRITRAYTKPEPGDLQE